MKIVIDTNCLIQMVGRNTPYHAVFKAVLSGQLTLLLSKEVALEYEEVISLKTSQAFTDYLLKALIENPFVLKVEIFFKWDLIKADKDDNKFLDLGLNGGADYLITNDKHFNDIKAVKFPSLKIITLNDFFNTWNQQPTATTP